MIVKVKWYRSTSVHPPLRFVDDGVAEIERRFHYCGSDYCRRRRRRRCHRNIFGIVVVVMIFAFVGTGLDADIAWLEVFTFVASAAAAAAAVVVVAAAAAVGGDGGRWRRCATGVPRPRFTSVACFV